MATEQSASSGTSSTAAASAASVLAQLKRKRTIIKAGTTRIESYVNSIDEVDDDARSQLIVRRSRLSIYWDEYNAIQTKIEEFNEAEIRDRETFEETHYAVCARIARLTETGDRGPETRSSSRSGLSGSNGTGAVDVRLPKISLPNFAGRYEDWFPFHDTFVNIVHNNPALADVQKLQYLKASLSGEARNLIDALEISALNYNVAWEILRERYHNERVIVYTHIKAIVDLPPMQRESAVELRSLCDGLSRHLRALKALKRDADKWDDIVIYLTSAKLDSVTLREWHASLTGSALPTLKEFTAFLSHRSGVLESAPGRNAASQRRNDARVPPRNDGRRHALHAVTGGGGCLYCRGDHAIYSCGAFAALATNQRISEVRKRKACLNCLRSSSHRAAQCPSGTCRVCGGKHHSLLHLRQGPAEGSGAGENGRLPAALETAAASGGSTALVARGGADPGATEVFLSTALVYVFDGDGRRQLARALLDSGSQANFITADLSKKMKLNLRAVNIAISGVGRVASRASRITRIRMRSRAGAFETEFDCIVTDRITERIPATTLRRDAVVVPDGLRLADPQYYRAAEVDLLVGAEIFWQLLCVGQVRATHTHPTLQNTRLGWVLAGRATGVPSAPVRTRAMHAVITNAELNNRLNKFWALEDLTGAARGTPEQQKCEEHFNLNVGLDDTGRYVVKLPLKTEALSGLGESRGIALRRFHLIEKRFTRDANLKQAYAKFMREYLELGHMRLVAESDVEKPGAVYLAHHGVYKKTDAGAKLRVVFDASCNTEGGIALNQALMTGPTIQQELATILTRFRMWQYVFSADIIKMYRQIWVHASQTHLQRIVWRESPEESVKTYELRTVTYGTTSAPFLATGCLQHLARRFEGEYPIGAERVLRDFYVDDLLTGADTLGDAVRARDQIRSILKQGHFELSKWQANDEKLIPDSGDVGDKLNSLTGESNDKILGVRWNPKNDDFEIESLEAPRGKRVTKRTMLAEIASVFDPLGILGPLTVRAKIIMQEAWMAKIDWEQSLPQDLHLRWMSFREQLRDLRTMRVPRWVGTTNARAIQLHGFCDASERAYGACVYVRTAASCGRVRVSLLTSKSRVAPVRAVSLPRLELSAALLLAQLIEKLNEAFTADPSETILWSDSTVALQWIASPSRKWKAFVANRVGEIQRAAGRGVWRHVPSAENPADILSRGASVDELRESTLWWNGPAFLLSAADRWPQFDCGVPAAELPEQRKVVLVTTTVDGEIVRGLLERFSNLNKMLRIVAYCRRFVRARNSERTSINISPGEMQAALRVIIKRVQCETFKDERKQLRDKLIINNRSEISALTPFLDDEGMIRVGGRLRDAAIPYDARHPILLPKRHMLTTRIIEAEHRNTLHAGAQTTLAAVRQRFWPIAARSVVRGVVRRCVTCFRCKPKLTETIMANLPENRVTVSRPFTHVGVDYAGPVLLKEGRRRNAKLSKAYLSIFVCFTVRAVHLEIVSDLTSDSFLAAFKRFISRRGRPACVYSDNGTTFVGANRAIKEMHEFARSEQAQSTVRNYLSEKGIDWRFIPPHAPHFGGLWEAAVKSTKTHLNRVIGQAHLTFEELQTVLCEIEAVLNSRPLSPLSTDANDTSCLTPGHFLIGAALSSFPVSDLTQTPEGRLVRWQRVEQLRQQFWKRWSEEYLHTLVQRTKWRASKGAPICVGQLALVQQPGLGPLHWLLGRVTEVHPGADGEVRAATLKTKRGTITRPTAKLAVLPFETDEVEHPRRSEEEAQS